MNTEAKDIKKEEVKVSLWGLLAKKIGMTQIYDEEGNVIPVTVLEAGPCVITQVKTKEKDGYLAIQVGFGQKKRKATKPLSGHLKGKNFKYLREFKVDNSSEYQVGQEIKADVFKAGDMVSVSGETIGKGFAGTIKRWNFARGPMSHGSKSHRRPGSIGAGTTPGRVLKGKKMAGQMGAKKCTLSGLTIVEVDTEKNLLLIKGPVPGHKENLVVVEKNS